MSVAEAFSALLGAAEGYLEHLWAAGPDGVGEPEDTLWVVLVRARNDFLTARDKETAA